MTSIVYQILSTNYRTPHTAGRPECGFNETRSSSDSGSKWTKSARFSARVVPPVSAARYAEEGGADLIVTYALARWHQAGFSAGIGLAPFGDGNALAFEVGTREFCRS